MTFSQVNPSTEGITPNPAVPPHNPGIGQRIFPDKDFPDERETTDRRLVRVTATLSQPVANVPVYFRNFDLDDPTDDTTVDPNGNAGNDNIGAPLPGTLSSTSAVTNANGVARVEFTVTGQPGNNFAIAASTTEAQANAVTINGIELANGAGQNIPTVCTTEPVCRSQMLTVWRRLHIEVDSMGLADGNIISGTIPGGFRISPNQTRVVPLTPSPNVDLEVNRFEDGRLAVGIRSLRVESNTTDAVTVRNMTSSAINIGTNVQFQLYDDDDFNDNDGTTLTGDTGEDILAPDGGGLNGTALLTAGSDIEDSNAFAPAYVRPVYDVVDPRDNCSFQANTFSSATGDLRPLRTLCWDSGGTNADPAFWSVHIYGAYQHTTDEDNDSATDGLTWGIVDSITLHPDPFDPTDDGEGTSAFIFVELLRPRETPGYTSVPTNLNSMAVTVAHEVGHLFSCRHGDGGLMGTDPVFGTPASNRLSPTMIRNVRVLNHP